MSERLSCGAANAAAADAFIAGWCAGSGVLGWWCVRSGVLNLDPHALRLTPTQRERRVTDAHHERITPRARLGEDFHLLAAHEAELEEPALQRRQGRRDRADADHSRGGAGGQRGEAHETRFESKSLRCGDGVHGCNYG